MTRGAIRPADMETLHLEQYLGLRLTLEDMS